MEESRRKQRNAERLAELYDRFARRVERVIQSLEGTGLRPRIQCAFRAPADQLEAYRSGTSKLRFGFHNITGPGGRPEALAVDLLDDDNPLRPGPAYLLRLAAAAEANACTTGIRWGLPARLSKAVDRALESDNWNAVLKIGWDPTHVQPSDLSLAEAKAGKRPLE